MTKGQARTLNALYAVDVFFDFFAARIPNTAANPARQRFARALAELIWHVDTQEAAPLMSRGLTKARSAKVTALKRDHMRHIVRIARLEAADIPELAPLKMPRGEVGIHKLLSSATGLAVIADQYRNVFIAGGCKPSFVDDLYAAIDDITETLTSRTQRNGDRAAATIGLKALLTRCTKLVAILDGFIQTEAHDRVVAPECLRRKSGADEHESGGAGRAQLSRVSRSHHSLVVGVWGLSGALTIVETAEAAKCLSSATPLTIHSRRRAAMSVGHISVGEPPAPTERGAPSEPNATTGLLGIDVVQDSGRYRIARIYRGDPWVAGQRGPLAAPGIDVRDGEYLIDVNGKPLSASDNFYRAFDATAGRPTKISVGNASGRDARQITVTPTGSEDGLRTFQWVQDNIRRVDSLSRGRIAYIYMMDPAARFTTPCSPSHRPSWYAVKSGLALMTGWFS